MSKWEVEIRDTEIYSLEVEAETEMEAKENAYNILGSGVDKYDYHYDSESEASAEEQE